MAENHTKNPMIDVFFYGLFMDQSLLVAKGLSPVDPRKGCLEGFGLRIGERATLVPAAGERAYGVVASLLDTEVTALYTEESVADYVAEPVSVTLLAGGVVKATCYNLPKDRLAGRNQAYAKTLLRVARDWGFPQDYLDTIKQFGEQDEK